MLRAPHHRLGMMDHLIHGDRKGVLITQDGHGQRVSHKNDVDPCPVLQQGHGIIIGRQHGDPFALFLHCLNIDGCNFFTSI